MPERLRRINLSQGELTGPEQIMQRAGKRPKPELRAGGKRGGEPIAPGTDRRLARLIGAKRPKYRRAGGAFCRGTVT